jgi:hypothetical protein
MISNEYAVAFTLPDANDFVEASGLLRYDSSGVHLEFQTKDALFGVIKSGVKSVHITHAQLRALHYRKSWFRHFIILQTKDMKSLKDVPGAESGEVRLKIKKSDMDQAQSMGMHVSSALTDARLKRLVEESASDE